MPEQTHTISASEVDVAELTRRYVDAQLQGDRREALRLVTEEGLARGLSVPDVHLQVIQPAQYEIGRRWRLNEISIAQEHIATAVSQVVVAQLYERLPAAEPNGRTVVVACAPGELHELGARMAADIIETEGFAVRFLGANVPAADLARVVVESGADLVVLSAATSLCFPGLREALQAVHDAAPGVPLFVGGNAFTWSAACEVPAGVVHAGHDARQLVDAVRRELLAA